MLHNRDRGKSFERAIQLVQCQVIPFQHRQMVENHIACRFDSQELFVRHRNGIADLVGFQRLVGKCIRSAGYRKGYAIAFLDDFRLGNAQALQLLRDFID